ncbi:MAG: hypothetical protein PHP74_03335 [Candidatus Gracilibacteria bacterium]|nr:hypothetical protein [Candidatus Gracilibacteria bacterium]
MNTEEEKIKNLENDMYIMETTFSADSLYASILDALNIDSADVVYRNLVLGILQKQTKNRIILSIWKNLDKDQKSHLKDFISQTSFTAPFMELDDVLMTFANLYPELMKKVYQDLTKFFKNFIENFKKIRKISF